jgi:AcrR family transcriptional regulator
MKKRPETEQRILNAAWKAFRARGLARIEMKEVATRAGVGRTTLYRYFSDKERLTLRMVHDVFRRYSERLDRRLQAEQRSPEGTALDMLRRLMAAWLESSEPEADDWFLAEFDAYAAKERVSKGFAQELQRVTRLDQEGDLVEIARRGIADGSIRSDIDPHLLYVTVLNTLRAVKNRLILRGDHLFETSPTEREAITSVLLTLLSDGIRGEQNEQ